MSNLVQEELKGKNWVATMMLCWALGSFGAHRFYTGKILSAWIMLILTVTGIFAPISAIWTVVDGIIISVGKFKHADNSDLYERIEWLGTLYIGMILGTIILVALVFALISAGIAMVDINSTGILPALNNI